MRKIALTISIILSSLLLFAQGFNNLNFGTDSTLDIVSWNIEWFPKNGQTTINNVKNIVLAIDAEIIAVQEVDSKSSFQSLINELEGYSGYYLNGEYQSLAYLYKTAEIQIESNYEIYTNDWREFPRSPLVMEFIYKSQKYIVINNHLKCCGDGSLDPYDSWDEESRRLDACNMINTYLREYLNDEKVIILGDLNDELTDRMQDNVFATFINNGDQYQIADMEIAEGSSSGWSYPNWPSHLDHIIISNELFSAFNHSSSACETIKPDEHFYGGYYEYDEKVSDHRPVGIKLKTNAQTAVEEVNSLVTLKNYPNPFTHSTTVFFKPSPQNTELKIYNIKGQLVSHDLVSLGQSSFTWNTKNQPQGIYYGQLLIDKKPSAIWKMMLLK